MHPGYTLKTKPKELKAKKKKKSFKVHKNYNLKSIPVLLLLFPSFKKPKQCPTLDQRKNIKTMTVTKIQTSISATSTSISTIRQPGTCS